MRILPLLSMFALLAMPAAARQAPPQAAPSENTQAAETLAKQIVQEIAAGQFERVEQRYSAQMSAALPSGTLAKAWANALEQEGSFDSVVSTTPAGKFQKFDVIVAVCKFQKGLIDVQLALGADGALGGIHFGAHREPLPPWTPAAYIKPDSFTESPLTIVNGKFEMPGTLTVPKSGGPFAAVALVHDSSPQDEDETVGANKPLKDLAWGLASNGVAVFRYEKRTHRYSEKSSEDPAKLTVDDETISDARAAVALVAKQPKIDPRRIFLVGLGLGGYLAPRIATGDTQIAGIAMLGANTQPLEQILLDEVRYVVSHDASPTPSEQQQVIAVEDTVKKIDSPDLKQGDTVAILGGAMPASYWLDLRGYHAVEAAQALKIPMLVLQGGRDFQVPPNPNFDEWKSALSSHKNVTLKLYPALNHLFVAGTGPSMPLEYDKPGHVDEQVIDDIAAWIGSGGERPHLR